MMRRSLLVLTLSLLGCGSGTAWTPPPSAGIPVAPRPDQVKRPVSSKQQAAKSVAPAVTAPAPEPISGALPADIDAKLVTHATCSDRDCLVPGLYPAGAAADGGAPAAIWSHDLPDKGTSVTFPRHSGVDLYGLVLRGNVRVKPLEGGAAKTIDLAGWGAFRAPGAGVSVVATDGAARVVLAVVGEAALLKERKTLKQVAWRSRPSAVETVDLNAAADLAWGKGAMHARLGFEGGRASFGILFASKDAPVAPHVHEGEWEILAPLWADGTARRAAGAGSQEMSEIPVTDGTVVAIPKGTLHAWVPGGKKPLLAVQMYLPPGPEQRFKKLAADAGK
jgi:mannose-6-phosphate isomerase-like protein (cupin superfamily)